MTLTEITDLVRTWRGAFTIIVNPTPALLPNQPAEIISIDLDPAKLSRHTVTKALRLLALECKRRKMHTFAAPTLRDPSQASTFPFRLALGGAIDAEQCDWIPLLRIDVCGQLPDGTPR